MQLGAAQEERQAAGAGNPVRRLSDIRLEMIVAQMLASLRIAVVCGGDKSDRGAVINISANRRPWKSYEIVAHDIAAALTRLGARNVSVYAEDMRLAERLKDDAIDLVWLNSGGVQGLCSVAHGAAVLEMLGIPYIGHDPLAAALLDNKHVFKRQLVAMGIPTAPFAVWHPGQDETAFVDCADFSRVFGGSDRSFIVKPVSGRASLHVHHVACKTAVAEAIAQVYAATRNAVLVESFLPGAEYCIAVAGRAVMRGGRATMHDKPFTFSAVERLLSPGEHVFTSMDKRPISGDRLRVLTPAADGGVMDALVLLADDVFSRFNLSTLIRIDIRTDANGNLAVLEANPKPDLKAPEGPVTSIVSTGLASHKMSYDDLIHSIFADRIATFIKDFSEAGDRLVERSGCHRIADEIKAK